MSILEGLSKEEEKFTKNNLHLAEEVSRTYEEIGVLLGGYAISIKDDNLDAIGRKFLIIIYTYLVPAMFQYYESILETLKNGNKLPAASLFRTQLEMYIDFWFLCHNQNLAERYLEYHHITVKWFTDAEGNTGADILSNYNNFRKKFNVQRDAELSSWSGVSIRKMALKIPDMGDSIYSFYSRYSAYTHPSSNAMIILGGRNTKVEDEVLHEVFYDSFFMGAYILLLTVANLSELFKLEGDDDYVRLYRKARMLEEKLNALRRETSQWKSTVTSFYGEGEVRV